MSDKQRPSARWSEVVDSAPELAQAVQDRFEAHPHHVVATLHADGRPRVTGTNVMFNDGMFWMGSMDSSRRGADLLRDPRCAVHSAPLDEEMGEGAGDARVEAIDPVMMVVDRTVTSSESSAEPGSRPFHCSHNPANA